jgi:RNA polymerase sigma-70 factor (ECF subfamily)
MGQPPQDAHEAVEAGELDDIVERALHGLPERRRLAMTLRWKHDLSPLEIARVLGTTPESVRVLLTRARQELRALLDRAKR